MSHLQLGENETLLGHFRGYRLSPSGKRERVDFYVTDEFIHFQKFRIPYEGVSRFSVSEGSTFDVQTRDAETGQATRFRWVVEDQDFGTVTSAMTLIYSDDVDEKQKNSLQYYVADIMVRRENREAEAKRLRSHEPLISSGAVPHGSVSESMRQSPVVAKLTPSADGDRIEVELRQRLESEVVRSATVDLRRESEKEFARTLREFDVTRRREIDEMRRRQSTTLRTLRDQHAGDLKRMESVLLSRDNLRKEELIPLTEKYREIIRDLAIGNSDQRKEYDSLIQTLQKNVEDEIAKIYREHHLALAETKLEFKRKLARAHFDRRNEAAVLERRFQTAQDESSSTLKVVADETTKTVRTMLEQHREQIARLRKEHEASLGSVEKRHLEEQNRMQEAHEATLSRVREEGAKALEESEGRYQILLEESKKQKTVVVNRLDDELGRTTVQLQKDHHQSMSSLRSHFGEGVKAIELDHHNTVSVLKEEGQATIDAMVESHSRVTEDIKKAYERQIQVLRQEYEETLRVLREDAAAHRLKEMATRDETVAAMMERHREECDEIEKIFRKLLIATKEDSDDRFWHQKKAYEKTIQALQNERATTIQNLQSQFGLAVQDMEFKFNSELRELRNENATLRKERAYLVASVQSKTAVIKVQEANITSLERTVDMSDRQKELLSDQLTSSQRDFELASAHFTSLQEDKERTLSEIARLQEEELRANKMREISEAGLYPYVQRVQMLESRIAERDTELEMMRRHMREGISYREQLIQENKFIRGQFALLRETIKELSAKLNIQKDRNTKAERIIQQIKKQQHERPLGDPDDLFHLKRLEKDHEDLVTRFGELSETHGVMANTKRKTDRQLTALRKLQEQSDATMGRLRKESTVARTALEDANDRLTDARDKIVSMFTTNKQLEHRIATLEAHITGLGFVPPDGDFVSTLPATPPKVHTIDIRELGLSPRQQRTPKKSPARGSPRFRMRRRRRSSATRPEQSAEPRPSGPDYPRTPKYRRPGTKASPPLAPGLGPKRSASKVDGMRQTMLKKLSNPKDHLGIEEIDLDD